jgi:hypothetical protein
MILTSPPPPSSSSSSSLHGCRPRELFRYHQTVWKFLTWFIFHNCGSRGFDSRWCHWNFHWHKPSGRTMAVRSTQPLTEISNTLKAAGELGWQCYCHYVQTVLTAGSLKLLEPSGPVYVYIAIALPFFCLSLSIHRACCSLLISVIFKLSLELGYWKFR